MKYIQYGDEVNIGDKYYIVHNLEIKKVTISDIDDISRHGSPHNVAYVQEVNNEYFKKFYETYEEAEQVLVESCLGRIRLLRKDIDKIEEDIKHIENKMWSTNINEII